jgi:flagellar basal body-associated protein FliL
MHTLLMVVVFLAVFSGIAYLFVQVGKQSQTPTKESKKGVDTAVTAALIETEINLNL